MLTRIRMNKRAMTVAVFAVVAVATLALSLALVTGASEAAGPGRGRGNGGGNGGGGNGAGNGAGAGVGAQGQGPSAYNGQGTGTQDQLRDQLQDGTCDGTGDCTYDQLQLGNGYGRQGANGQGQGLYGGGILLNLPAATPGELPDDVVDALQAGMMDEYNARTTYQAMIQQFGAVRPFTNVLNAELTHANALAFMFQRYGLDVPQPQPAQTMTQFASLEQACAAAADAEIANMGLYDEWLATVQDYPDLVQVFQALRDASEFQHLPAFEACAG